MRDFGFATEKEIRIELGERLRVQRLAQGISQVELAQRSTVSVSTLKLLEGKGRCTFETFIRVTLALGLADEMQSLFKLRIRSIADMERAERPQRLRAPRKSMVTGAGIGVGVGVGVGSKIERSANAASLDAASSGKKPSRKRTSKPASSNVASSGAGSFGPPKKRNE